MDLDDIELVRIGGSHRRIAFGLVALAVLMVAAIAKPWAGSATPRQQAEPSAHQEIAALTSRPAVEEPTASPQPPSMCQNTDAWLVVADDIELGRTVRSWIVATVRLSTGETMPPTVPLTVLVAPSGLRALGFCAPTATGSSLSRWTGTLWRMVTTGDGPSPEFVTALSTSTDSLGALTDPVVSPPLQVGTYVIEGHNQGTGLEAWFGIEISPAR